MLLYKRLTYLYLRTENNSLLASVANAVVTDYGLGLLPPRALVHCWIIGLPIKGSSEWVSECFLVAVSTTPAHLDRIILDEGPVKPVVVVVTQIVQAKSVFSFRRFTDDDVGGVDECSTCDVRLSSLETSISDNDLPENDSCDLPPSLHADKRRLIWPRRVTAWIRTRLTTVQCHINCVDVNLRLRLYYQ